MKEQIREALERATLGPWNREGKEIWYRGEGYEGRDRHIYVCDVQGNNNAHLIANAPEWLRWQNERIEQLEKALEDIHHYGKDSVMGKFYANIARQALGMEE